MLRRLLALLLPFALIPAAEAAPPRPVAKTPKAFVDDIYSRWEAEDRLSHGGGGREPDGPAVYAPPLVNLLVQDGVVATRQGEPNLIDYVVLCSCNDDGGIHAVSTVVAATSSAATVRVVLTFAGGNRRVLTLHLRHLPVGWRIADIVTPETPSLVAYLRKGLGVAATSSEQDVARRASEPSASSVEAALQAGTFTFGADPTRGCAVFHGNASKVRRTALWNGNQWSALRSQIVAEGCGADLAYKFIGDSYAGEYNWRLAYIYYRRASAILNDPRSAPILICRLTTNCGADLSPVLASAIAQTQSNVNLRAQEGRASASSTVPPRPSGGRPSASTIAGDVGDGESGPPSIAEYNRRQTRSVAALDAWGSRLLAEEGRSSTRSECFTQQQADIWTATRGTTVPKPICASRSPARRTPPTRRR